MGLFNGYLAYWAIHCFYVFVHCAWLSYCKVGLLIHWFDHFLRKFFILIITILNHNNNNNNNILAWVVGLGLSQCRHRFHYIARPYAIRLRWCWAHFAPLGAYWSTFLYLRHYYYYYYHVRTCNHVLIIGIGLIPLYLLILFVANPDLCVITRLDMFYNDTGELLPFYEAVF